MFLGRRRRGGDNSSPDSSVGGGSTTFLDRRGILIFGADRVMISPTDGVGGDIGRLGGDKGETGPKGPGLMGEAGDIPRLCKSGGEGVNSPDEGGEAFGGNGGAFNLLRTGGVLRGSAGEGDKRLTGGYGGGSGEIDSYDPLRVLIVRRLRGIPGGGEPASRIPRIRLGVGEGDLSIRRLCTGGGDGLVSSR